MQRRRLIAGSFAVTGFALAGLTAWRPALADPVELRILRPLDLATLPLLIMQHEHLIERTAEAMAVAGLTVTWGTPDNAPPLSALMSGKSDLVAAGLVPFLLAADAAAGTPGEIKAIGALAQRPYVLVTRKPSIQTIRDFTSGDRIAVPEVKISGPAVMLEMAAAQEWGQDKFDKLDALTLAMPDENAAMALLSGKGEIIAHFSRSPFSDGELGDPAIHRVMDSFDIAGPHSSAVLVMTTRFRNANPILCAAILSALQQADDFMKKSPGAAAEIYDQMVKDSDIPLEALTDMIGDPDLTYTAAPAGVLRLSDFLNKTGRTKNRPASWQDLFLPESRDLAGN